MEDERNWFVGVDWASETHHVRVSDARGRKLGARAFAHSGEGLAAMAAWILELTGAAPEAVFVAIEVPHGPVVESLMERGFRVHAINPKQLDRFRDRFSPAGGQINQVTTSPMPAEKIATTVIQPRTLGSTGHCVARVGIAGALAPTPSGVKRCGRNSGVPAPACGSGPGPPRPSQSPDARPYASAARPRSRA